MKRFLIIAVLIMMLAVPVFAQWGGSIAGDTIKHRDSITYADDWFTNAPKLATSGSLELAGFNSVRADYDFTNITLASVNLMCSNDSLWVSGDSINITEDKYESYDLTGCDDYYIYIEEMVGAGSMTIYVTPYQD